MYHSKEVQTVPNNKTTPVQDLNLNFQFVATISIPIWIQIWIFNAILYRKSSIYIVKDRLYGKLVEFNQKQRFTSKKTTKNDKFDQI